MKKTVSTFFLMLVFLGSEAQVKSLLEKDNRWVLLTTKIEKAQLYLTPYKPEKVKYNTLVMNFEENGKINYDYESNPKFATAAGGDYLDIDLEESSWEYDSLYQTINLTIKGGYSSIDDFKFTRKYLIQGIADGYVLKKIRDISFENLKQKAIYQPPAMHQTVYTSPPTQIVSNERKSGFVINTDTPASQSVTASISVATPVVLPIAEPIKIDYAAQNSHLFDASKRWILIRNKIERGDIYLTAYDESKLSINNLVFSLLNNGTIAYDYESDPKIKICAGVDFLDIDTEQTQWSYDSNSNIITLTVTGGYASIDDFKFKRDYFVELFDDGFALRKVKEHYFEDLKQRNKK